MKHLSGFRARSKSSLLQPMKESVMQAPQLAKVVIGIQTKSYWRVQASLKMKASTPKLHLDQLSRRTKEAFLQGTSAT